MSMIASGCFLVLLFLGLSGLRRGADLFSPTRVFAGTWALTIGLAELKLSRLQHSWSFESWLVLLLGPLAFLVGVLVVSVFYMDVPLPAISRLRKGWQSLLVSEQRLFSSAAVLFGLFLLGYVSIVASGKEIPLLSARPGRARLAFQLFGVGLFLHNAVLIVVLSVIYYLKVSRRKFRKAMLAGMSISALLLYGLTLQRFQIVMAAVLCVTVLYYSTRHLRPLTITLYFGLATVFFLLISTVRSGQLFVYYLYLDSQMTFSPSFAFFTEPYMYFAMNVENFARAVEHLETFSLGAFTFDFLGALSGLKHWLRDYFGLVETPFLNSGYNTYTLFWPYYRDFGLAGLLVLPFAGGLVVSRVYFSMRRSPTIQNIVWYAVCVFIMLFSFYLNPLTFLWFVYNLVVLAIVLRIIESREKLMVPPEREGEVV